MRRLSPSRLAQDGLPLLQVRLPLSRALALAHSPAQDEALALVEAAARALWRRYARDEFQKTSGRLPAADPASHIPAARRRRRPELRPSTCSS